MSFVRQERKIGDTIGVGLVGLGWVAEKVHLPYFANCSLVDTIGLYDIDPQRMEILSQSSPFSRTMSYISIGEMLSDDNINLVVIATPNTVHASQIVEAVQAGKRVFCEKPICTNEAEAQVLVSWLEKYPDAVFVGLSNRFRQDVIKLHELLTTEPLGHTYRVRASWLRNSGIPRSNWFLDWERSGGGVLVDLGSHLIDLILWLLGFPKVKQVSAVCTKHFFSQPEKYACWHGTSGALEQPSVEDNASVFIKCEDLACSIDLAWAGHYQFDETNIEIFAENGYLHLKTLFGFSPNTDRTKSELIYTTARNHQVYEFDLQHRMRSYVTMLDSYVTAVVRGERPPIAPVEALASVRLIDRIYHEG